jgi:hypothetical protein
MWWLAARKMSRKKKILPIFPIGHYFFLKRLTYGWQQPCGYGRLWKWLKSL